MNAFKKHSIVLFFMLTQMLLFAQNHTSVLYGKVFDSENGEPLIGATISLLGNNSSTQGTITEIEGNYQLENVKVGRQDFVINYLGYESVFLSQILVSSGKSLNIDISMIQSLSKIDEIEITATSKSSTEVNNEMATVSARSFSQEQSTRFAASLTDPSRLVLSFPGVRSQGDIQNDISVRGNSPTGMFWALDGYEIPSPNHFARNNARGAVNMLSTNSLQGADFYTAAFPAQYGNATSGVFDLQMRKGNTDQIETSISIGFLGLEASLEGPLSKKKKASFLVAYRFSTLSALNKIGYNLTGDEDPRFQDINYKFHWKTKKAGTFQLFGLYGDSRISPTADLDEYNYTDRYRLFVGGLKNQKRVSEKSLLQSAIIFNSSYKLFEDEESYLHGENYFNNNDILDRILGVRKQFYPIKENSIQFDAKISTKFSAKHSMKMGLNLQYISHDTESKFSRKNVLYIDNEFERIEFEDTDSTIIKAKSLKINAFMQQKYKVNTQLSFTAGLHFQSFRYNKSFAIEPRLGMQYTYRNGQEFSLGVGLHSRLEPLSFYGVERNVYNQLDPYNVEATIEPNRYLQPTRAVHFVIGNRFTLAPKLKLDVELYYQHLYNVPILEREETHDIVLNERYFYDFDTYINEGLGRNYGMDISLEKALARNYYFLVNGSIYSSKYKANEDVWRHTRFAGNFILSTTLGKDFVVGKNKNNRISLNTKFVWAGNNRREFSNPKETIDQFGFPETTFDYFSERLANYYRWDNRIAYIRNKEKYAWTLSIDIQNTTNHINETDNPEINAQGLLPIAIYKVDF